MHTHSWCLHLTTPTFHASQINSAAFVFELIFPVLANEMFATENLTSPSL